MLAVLFMALQTHKAKPGHHRPEKDTSRNSFFRVHTFCSTSFITFFPMPFVRNVSHKSSLYRLPHVHLPFSNNLGVFCVMTAASSALCNCGTYSNACCSGKKNFIRLRFVTVYAGMLNPASYS